MYKITSRNVNEAYALGLRLLHEQGVPEESRVGPVWALPAPVTTTYRRPCERVLFDARRDANPFFHLLESMWMLAGRNDVAWLTDYNARIHEYSDDGKVFHGAYGHRWRHHFDRDQLADVAGLLYKDPGTRRAFIGMWDPRCDGIAAGKDFPCNVGITFRIRDMRLDMTVFNRSNDIIWGAYGANAVHMSVLQEWLAATVGCGVGAYYQVSNNYHAYQSVLEQVGVPDPAPDDPYEQGKVAVFPMIQDVERWNYELLVFMNDPMDIGFVEPFFANVLRPMVQAWWSYKKKNYSAALTHASMIAATDWRKACHDWLVRRHEKAASRRQRQTLAYGDDGNRPKRS